MILKDRSPEVTIYKTSKVLGIGVDRNIVLDV